MNQWQVDAVAAASCGMDVESIVLKGLSYSNAQAGKRDDGGLSWLEFGDPFRKLVVLEIEGFRWKW